MQSHAVRIVSVLGIGIGQKIRAHAAVERSPVGSRRRSTRTHRHSTCRCTYALASRGSIRTECSFGPSGVPSLSSPHQALRCGCSLKPSTPRQVAPPSSERNSPCGEVPAYHDTGLRKRGPASARTCDRRRGHCPRRNAGGCLASCHVRPRSCRAEDRRTKMPGARSGEHRLAVARIGHAVVDDVPEELRSQRGARYAALHRCAFATSPCASR